MMIQRPLRFAILSAILLAIWVAVRGAADQPRLLQWRAAQYDSIPATASLGFTPDSKHLLAASEDAKVRWWNPDDGSLARTVSLLTEEYAWYWIACPPRFSPDGTRVAAAGRDRTLRVWDTSSGAVVQTLKVYTRYLRSLCFSPDGKLLAVATWPARGASEGSQIDIWKVADASLAYSVTVPIQPGGLAFSSDGERFYAVGEKESQTGSDRAVLRHSGALYSWNLRTGAPIQNYADLLSPGCSVSCSYDGNWIAGAGRGEGVAVWKPACQQPEQVLPVRALTDLPDPRALLFTPDSHRLICAQYRGVSIWDVDTGKPYAELNIVGPPRTAGAQDVGSIAVSRDGRWLAVEDRRYRAATLIRLDRVQAQPELLRRRRHSPGPAP